jgi:hypothetical protein
MLIFKEIQQSTFERKKWTAEAHRKPASIGNPKPKVGTRLEVDADLRFARPPTAATRLSLLSLPSPSSPARESSHQPQPAWSLRADSGGAFDPFPHRRRRWKRWRTCWSRGRRRSSSCASGSAASATSAASSTARSEVRLPRTRPPPLPPFYSPTFPPPGPEGTRDPDRNER